jgi:hypothetical protein
MNREGTGKIGYLDESWNPLAWGKAKKEDRRTRPM